MSVQVHQSCPVIKTTRTYLAFETPWAGAVDKLRLVRVNSNILLHGKQIERKLMFTGDK